MLLSMLFAGATVLPLFASASPVAPKGISIPISKPTPGSGPVANIPALRRQLAQLGAKYARTLGNFKKNTGTDHPLATAFKAPSGLSRRATGSDPLTDDSDKAWYGDIAIGTLPVTFKIIFDTASSTSTDLKKTFAFKYEDGSSASGELFTDTVSVAGLTATGQTLGSATNYSSSLRDSAADGVMGLAFPSISSYPCYAIFQQPDQPGQDSSLYSGSINWNPVTVQGYWQIALDAVSTGSSQPVTGISSIIDSGTTLIIGDSQSVAAFYAAISGSKDASKCG
ncbi:hypothetical protein BS47DRAFT_1357390 [Hydnum rufescens UP504]|uniref:Peptidase A1 domain-containing protein n=1 Tax=Hydnum rufescens UP504 TaxID=1448309 RepID=A0A9P6BA58_9AGAM|nr:hypothetical protein BS47DRAFT_1357390 [Hydnum rufescens UP504]